MAPFNYGAFFGIQSVVAAFVFAVLYLCLTVLHVMQSRGNITKVYRALIVFCVIRLVAFVLRGIIAASDSAAENQTLVTVYEVVSSVGFLGILFAAYLLVLDRLALNELTEPTGPMALLRNVRLFSLGMTAVVVTGIVGVVETNDGRSNSDSSKASLGDTLRKVSTVLALILTIIQVVQSLILVKTEQEASGRKQDTRSWGARNGCWILLVIAILFLVREGFLIATISNSSTQANEVYWYPFVAVPEILAAMFYTIPGLVPPPQSELPRYAQTPPSYQQAMPIA